MRRYTTNISFRLVLLAGLAGLAAFACDDAAEGDEDAGVDTDTDADTDEGDCDLSSFYEGTDSFPEDLEESMAPFFDCPSTFALPADALPYKSQGIVPIFVDYVRYQAIQWVDASLLECCDLGEELTNCIEADYETGEGVAVSYRLEEISVDEWDEVPVSSSDSHEVIEISLPVGTEDWNGLILDILRSSYSAEEQSHSSSAWALEWVGSLLPGWPADYSVSATRASETADVATTQQTGWYHSGCELVMESNNDDIVYSNPEIPFYSVALPDTVLEIKSGPTLQEAWLNDVCVGQVDETTWEVVGECE